MEKGLLAHEWISETGGSEKVLESFIRAFPDTPLYCLWNERGWLTGDVRESWIARTPLRRHKALALPFMIPTWKSFDTKDAEWALISSHAFAHHITASNPQMRNYVYVHSPARYVWNPELDARGNHPLAQALRPILKSIDKRRAKGIHSVAANSEFVRERIANSWGVDARVIHPPVDVRRIQETAIWADVLSPRDAAILEELPRDFLLGASRFVSYKRLDRVIQIAEASDVPVVLAGAGPELETLRSVASQSATPVSFVLGPSDELLYALYQRCSAYIFPAVEDFGIMPVEAMAAGARVVGINAGGLTESVVNGDTGYLVDIDDPCEVKNAISGLSKIDQNRCREHARKFSNEVFETNIVAWVGGLENE